MKVYIASSWKNDRYSMAKAVLESHGHQIMDWRAIGDAFDWAQVDNEWESWNHDQYKSALLHPRSQEGYHSDMAKLQLADICVLLLPCGRSAHLEAGWAVGAGKPLIILGEPPEPELMYLMANRICRDMHEVVEVLRRL